MERFKTGYVIDDVGFHIDTVVVDLLDSDDILERLITVQPPHDGSLYKRQWNGSEWIEGATQEEIEDLIVNQLSPQPSELEILSNYVLDVDMRLIMIELGM